MIRGQTEVVDADVALEHVTWSDDTVLDGVCRRIRRATEDAEGWCEAGDQTQVGRLLPVGPQEILGCGDAGCDCVPRIALRDHVASDRAGILVMHKLVWQAGFEPADAQLFSRDESRAVIWAEGVG